MKAFGGRGMWFRGFFFEWAERRDAQELSSEGENMMILDGGGFIGGGGTSVKETGVTLGAKEMPELSAGSIG